MCYRNVSVTNVMNTSNDVAFFKNALEILLVTYLLIIPSSLKVCGKKYFSFDLANIACNLELSFNVSDVFCHRVVLRCTLTI